ncbi:MAG: (Fe-S)-binding protein [Thermodesulfovibrionales bacterium]
MSSAGDRDAQRRSVPELASCVRCGNCTAHCPSYRQAGTEGMGARGRAVLLKQFLDGALEPSALLDERIFTCILCGACNRLCPLGIDVTGAVYEGRRRLSAFNRKRKLLGLGMKLALKRPALSFRVLQLIEGLNEVFSFRRLTPFGLLRQRGITVPGSGLRDGESLFRVSRPRGRVAVFAGCTANFLSPHLGGALIRSLNALRYDVVLPKGEVCCGAPLMGLGRTGDAAELAERNMSVFRKLRVEAVVGLCPTCVHFIKNEYRKLGGDGIGHALDVAQFFAGERLPAGSGAPVPRAASRVVYHDPCHALNYLGVSAEPRRILRERGLTVSEAEGGCCGFGGSFRVLYPELSGSILEERREAYRSADMIVTSCPNCILQLRSGLGDKEVKHLIEIIEEGVKGEQTWERETRQKTGRRS